MKYPVLLAAAATKAAVGDTGSGLTYPQLVKIAYGLVNFALNLVSVVMVGVIVFYALQMATSGENPKRYEESKKNLKYAALGFLVAFGSRIIVASVRAAVTNQSLF